MVEPWMKILKFLKRYTLAALGVIILLSMSPEQYLHAKDNTSDIPLRATCVDAECHPKLKTKKYKHSPVILGTCDVCHTVIKNRHVFELVSTGPELCTFCHKLRLNNNIHEPVKKGECIKCHDSHGSDFPSLLKSDPGKHLCTSCHTKEEEYLSRKYTHAPAAQGACILCHQGHSSSYKNLLIDDGNELCLFCHKKEFEPLMQKKHIHKPVEENCQKCHDPHGSNNPMLIPESEPEFCFSCHEDIEELIKTSNNVHDAIFSEGSCSSCHAPHASSLPRLLDKPMLEMCLSCHDREVKAHDGTILKNIAELMDENPFKHGPIQQNNCIACHNPHASNIFRRLVSYFPREFYTPFDLGEYNLCFQCHTKDTFLIEQTTALTNFRDGDLNLHYLHVNKKVKGRSCRACHAMHASKQQAHVRSKVPFGDWEFPVRFKANIDGGTCESGCHDEKKYSRKYKKIEPIK
jgi:predicted CXXCH cytochrome family protein